MRIKLIVVATMALWHGVTLADEMILNNFTLVSAHLNAAQKNTQVRIVDGVITEVTTVPLRPYNPAATIIEGEGKYLTPGIMDSHVHVGSIPGIGFLDSPNASQYAGMVDEYLTQLPRSLLYYGITQVLNLGGSDGESRFTAALQHPDYFTCQSIPVIGGYPHLSAEFTLQKAKYFVIENPAKVTLPDNIDPAQHTPEAVVTAIAKTGSPCIKIYIEDGFGGASHWPLLTDDTLQRIRKAADKANLQIWAHANALDMYQIALEHKVDGIAHGLWNWQWQAAPDNPPVNATLDRLINTDTAYMPTIQVMLSLQEMYDNSTLSDERRKKVLPAALLQWYSTHEGQWFKREINADFGGLPDAKVFELSGYGVNRAKQAAAYLASHNHPLLLASDYPSSPSFAAAPGLSTYYEMQQMAAAGISASQIFAAATINGPQQFGLENQYGTIEPGKVANLLILHKNPKQDVENWQTIDTVILHGELIQRESLAVTPNEG